jgi:hypothetical protein
MLNIMNPEIDLRCPAQPREPGMCKSKRNTTAWPTRGDLAKDYARSPREKQTIMY